MTQCPICQTKIKDQDYCPICAWEFEYYFDELDPESRAVYEDRFKIWNSIYIQLSDYKKGLIDSKVKIISKRLPFEPKMICIEAGSFMMGSDEYDNTQPIHTVTIDYDYEIGKYPVTFKEYDYFCEETNKKKPNDNGWGRGERPVIDVSWYDAKEYVKWLSGKTDKNYRLPTESEWEYVARAGTETKWSCGDSENELKEYGWYYENSNAKTHQVGIKKPNPWGVYDMHGNVWEWCEDGYVDSYKESSTDGSAQADKKGFFSKKLDKKILRGGSWCFFANNTRSAIRSSESPIVCSDYTGFRIQRTLP